MIVTIVVLLLVIHYQFRSIFLQYQLLSNARRQSVTGAFKCWNILTFLNAVKVFILIGQAHIRSDQVTIVWWPMGILLQLQSPRLLIDRSFVEKVLK